MADGTIMTQASRSMDSEGMVEHHVAGTVLFREGEPGDRAYVIEAGIVEISTSVQAGQHVLKTLGTGEIVGEMAIIDDAPRSATATVVANSKLRVIHRLQLQERLHQADPILHMLMRLIAKRYRCSVSTLKNNSIAQEARDDSETNHVSRRAVDKFRMEGELRNAVDNQCLEVQYQPIVDLYNGCVIGFEALARWQHTHHGFVPPQTFIPLAEETNLIREIDEFVFKQAVESIKLINRRNCRNANVFICINVSARQLADIHYLDMARGSTKRAGLAPELVEFEITESQIAEKENAKSWISTAKAYGFGVALDDFGTGFSSLAQLLSLDVDTVKIDRSFVHKLGQTERSGQMIRGIIALAKSMKLSVIAEGIETPDQKFLLRQLDCRLGQGFFFGKPMPLEEILVNKSFA